MMKKILALVLAVGMLLGLAAAPGMAADKKVIIKIAGMKPEGEPETIGMPNLRFTCHVSIGCTGD